MTVSNIEKNNIYKMWNWLYEYDYMSAAVILVVTDKNKMSIHMSMYNAYEQRLTRIIIHCTHTIYFICVTDSLYFFFKIRVRLRPVGFSFILFTETQSKETKNKEQMNSFRRRRWTKFIQTCEYIKFQSVNVDHD